MNISHLDIYNHANQDRFSLSFPFEYVFNNTNIGELHFHGSIIPPGSYSLKKTFKGLVRSLTLHRHVNTIDSYAFPYYSSVYSYQIHSIEAYSMDLNSFIPSHTNLRGLNLIKPHFEVFIDKFIPTLESLSLDIEYLNERTLIAAQHINNLKLGSRLRRINSQALYFLKRLKSFDLSEINLSEMTSESRCYLVDIIYHNYQRELNIVIPRINNLTECDCARLILSDIQLTKNFKDESNGDILCKRKCCFSDCSTISEYFREKFPLFTKENQFTHNFSDVNNELPSIDLFSDSMDIDMMHFLINQTVGQQISINQR